MPQDDSTTLLWKLKEFYSKDYVKDTVYSKFPFYAMLERRNGAGVDAGGKYWVQPVGLAGGQGRSHTFGKAQANITETTGESFNVPYVSDYAVHKITRRVIKQMRGGGPSSDKAFGDLTENVDKWLKSLMRSLTIGLAGNGSKAIGRVGALPGGNVVTLQNPDSIVNFENGNKINAAAAETTGAIRTGAIEAMTVTSRDEGSTATNFTCSGGLVTGLSPGDWLFIEGDRNLGISGLNAWLPDTVTATPFHGVVRTNDTARLGGHRQGALNMSIAAALRKMATKITRSSDDFGEHLYWVTGDSRFEELCFELDSKVEYVDVETQEKGLFVNMPQINFGKGKMTVIVDRSFNSDRSYVVNLDDFFLVSLDDDIPNLWDEDGSMLFRDVGTPGWELRADYDCNLVCKDPRNNGVILHTTAP